MTKLLLRSSFVFAAIAATVCAQATITLIVGSAGTLTPNMSETAFAGVETVTSQVGGLSPDFTSFDYTLTPAAPADTGLGTYTSAAGTMTISFAYPLANVTGDDVNDLSFSGTWTYLSGTGDYANLTGGGSLSLTVLQQGPTSTYLNSVTGLAGALNAVPEPTSYAALGLGVVGLLVRRRRKA